MRTRQQQATTVAALKCPYMSYDNNPSTTANFNYFSCTIYLDISFSLRPTCPHMW